eukprot:6013788-Pleurochrysis_carterae.AAC.1
MGCDAQGARNGGRRRPEDREAKMAAHRARSRCRVCAGAPTSAALMGARTPHGAQAATRVRAASEP